MKAATTDMGILGTTAAISIHAAREGGDIYSRSHIAHYTISIHAAREGGDRDCNRFRKIYKISIHAAREGGDLP